MGGHCSRGHLRTRAIHGRRRCLVARPARPGGARGAGPASRRGGQRRAAGRRDVGRRRARTWNKVVQGCVVRLRKVLGAAAIETSPAGYRLTTPPDDVDAHRFERMVGRSSELLSLGEHDRAAYVSGEALALWRGPALRELEGWDAGRIEAAGSTSCAWTQRSSTSTPPCAPAATARCSPRRRPASPRRRCVSAAGRCWRWPSTRSGRQGDALRTLHAGPHGCSVEELGVEPGPELVALGAGDPAAGPVAASSVAALPSPVPACPYRGLRAVRHRRHRRLLRARRRRRRVPGSAGRSRRARRSSDPPAAASRRSCGPAWRPPCDAAAVGSWSSPPAFDPMDALDRVPASGPVPILVVDQCEEAVTALRGPRRASRLLRRPRRPRRTRPVGRRPARRPPRRRSRPIRASPGSSNRACTC